jgi:hypothetical protein
MPHTLFGFPIKGKQPTKLSVETSRGDLEPVEPSKFKIYAMPDIVTPLYSTFSTLLGHLVATLSFPQYSYMPLILPGEMFQPAENNLMFAQVGFGFSLKKGRTMTEAHSQTLEDMSFSTMKFADRLVWLKEDAGKKDYIWVVSYIPDLDDTSRIPNRFLNPSSFKSYLTLISLTTRICETMHRLCEEGEKTVVTSSMLKRNDLLGGWKRLDTYLDDPNKPMIQDSQHVTPTFEKSEVYKLTNGHEKPLASLASIMGSLSGTSFLNPGVVTNTFSDPAPGIVHTGSSSGILSHGLIFKFNQKLAIPDTNLIGDVVGKRFLTCLGSSREEQFSNLQSLKSGTSALRLTLAGDQLAHLYKCIDIAIDCQAGCVPFYSGDYYEGMLIMGGPGATISAGGKQASFDSVEELRTEFLTISDHSQAMRSISSKFPVAVRNDVQQLTSMSDFRKMCLDLECTADDRDYIIQKAVSLNFNSRSWVISPNKLKVAFQLMNNLDDLDESYPISRLCLFSKDPVMLALSCFGENTCPSWDIPSGTSVSLSGENPPVIPPIVQKGSNSKGQTSDAAWVMIVRRTDLFSAVDEFRKLAEKVIYRTIPSAHARKQGFLVFSRDKMSEFWKIMQLSYLKVNPDAKFGEDLESLRKRGISSVSEPNPIGSKDKKVRTLNF